MKNVLAATAAATAALVTRFAIGKRRAAAGTDHPLTRADRHTSELTRARTQHMVSTDMVRQSTWHR